MPSPTTDSGERMIELTFMETTKVAMDTVSPTTKPHTKEVVVASTSMEMVRAMVMTT
jgi:hypothetical protein